MRNKVKKNMARFVLISFYIFTSVQLASWSWAGSEFPSKPIELVVPYPAGGSTDLAARSIAKGAEQVLGQPIIIINKGGGGGVVGMSYVAMAKNDGYTLGLLPPAVFNAYYMVDIPFIPIEAFTPIMSLGGWYSGLFVKSDSPWKTLDEFIQYSKENPGKVKYASAGPGTTPQRAMAELGLKANVKWVHVPYKGDPESIPALLGGHVSAATGTSAFFPHVKSGGIRILAVYGDKCEMFPDVPTLQEKGYDVPYLSNMGIVAPKGLSGKIVGVLDSAFKNGMGGQAFIRTMYEYGMPIAYLGSADYKSYLENVDKGSAKMIAILGLQKKK